VAGKALGLTPVSICECSAEHVYFARADRSLPMPKTPLTDLVAYAGAFLTAGQLADYWGVSRKHILKLIETGCLESIRLGPKTYRIRVHAVIEFERQNQRRVTDGVVVAAARVPDPSQRALPDLQDRRSVPPHLESHPMTALSATHQTSR
jgi:excisionase family DNA binding protein